MKKKTLQRLIWTGLVLLGLTILVVLYIFNKPHRDIQKTKAFAELQIKDLLNEFTADPGKANAKYLSSDGNSKVLIVAGSVHSISLNQNNEKVIVLKETDSKVGVSCTFTEKTNSHSDGIKIGDNIKIKGAITAGNGYDNDLDIYYNAVLTGCDLIK